MVSFSAAPLHRRPNDTKYVKVGDLRSVEFECRGGCFQGLPQLRLSKNGTEWENRTFTVVNGTQNIRHILCGTKRAGHDCYRTERTATVQNARNVTVTVRNGQEVTAAVQNGRDLTGTVRNARDLPATGQNHRRSLRDPVKIHTEQVRYLPFSHKCVPIIVYVRTCSATPRIPRNINCGLHLLKHTKRQRSCCSGNVVPVLSSQGVIFTWH